MIQLGLTNPGLRRSDSGQGKVAFMRCNYKLIVAPSNGQFHLD
jgi:hypothetical protein